MKKAALLLALTTGCTPDPVMTCDTDDLIEGRLSMGNNLVEEVRYRTLVCLGEGTTDLGDEEVCVSSYESFTGIEEQVVPRDESCLDYLQRSEPGTDLDLIGHIPVDDEFFVKAPYGFNFVDEDGNEVSIDPEDAIFTLSVENPNSGKLELIKNSEGEEIYFWED